MTRKSPTQAPARRRTVAVPAARKHLLDVRVRRSTARRQRTNRAVRLAFGIALWLGLAAGAWFGFQAVTKKFFLENPAYDLRQVDTHLDGLLTREEALAITKISTGGNIFKIDLVSAEQALRSIEQVGSVTIQRDWPDKITITLTKRVPVAWLAQAGNPFNADIAWLLDAAGSPMKPYRIEPDYWHLPVIYCTDPALIKEGDTLARADLKAALDLLAERARRPAALLEIRSIDITKGYAMEVIDAHKALLTFSPKDPATQLDRVQKLLENCRVTGRQLESVNLIPKKYTPVRFLLAAQQDTVTTDTQPEAER